MEPLQRLIQDAVTGEIKADRACLLVLGTENEIRHNLVESVESTGHVCLVTDSVEEARSMIEAHDAIDAMLIDGTKGDRESLSLIREAQSLRPWLRAMVWSGSLDPTLTVDAIRDGASDFLVLPADADRLVARLDQILDRVRAARENEKRMNNLLDTCRQLTESRDEMSEQVDVLCNDLASAYRSMRDQMSDAVLVSEFKTLISQELDVEDMLRTALEYMLRRLGPTNAVVYLPEASDRFGIGAYVNYDMTDQDPLPLYRALGETLCKSLKDESGLVRFEDGEEWARANQIEAEILHGAELIAFACRYRGETLAIMTFFRSTPFEDSTAGMLDSLRTELGEQLGRIVRIHRRGHDEWPREATDDNGTSHDLEFPDDSSEWGDMAA
ncbi:MAG: hypothetical protein P8M22_05410 [Phycisphaerales bacterium]|nr:hypothetical protein [Phycisphaerales bacterium]